MLEQNICCTGGDTVTQNPDLIREIVLEVM